MVKIDKELDTMEANVMKMARQVISMHEKVVEVLEVQIVKWSLKSCRQMTSSTTWKKK